MATNMPPDDTHHQPHLFPVPDDKHLSGAFPEVMGEGCGGREPGHDQGLVVARRGGAG